MTTQPSWTATLRLGLIGGIVTLYLILVGMVEAFSHRDIIGGVIDMGRVLVFVSFYLTGYFALRRLHSAETNPRELIGRTALAGLANAALVVALLIFFTLVPGVRAIFVSASPALVGLLTFGQGIVFGSVLILLIGAALGASVGALQNVPAYWRTSLITAIFWTIIIGILQELLVITFRNSVGFLTSLLFASTGLSLIGTILVFTVVFTGAYVNARRGDEFRARFQELPTTKQQWITRGIFVFLILLLLSLPMVLGLFFSEVLVNVGLFVLMGLGLNIVVGFAGLLDLGYVAFFAIGAYVTALLTTTSTEIVFAGGWPFWAALPVAIAASAIGGALLGIPVLKIRGDYLAIVTLGFGEIIRLLFLSDFLKPWFGGSRGIELIPKPFIGSFELEGPQQLYYLILAGCLIVAFISLRLKSSRIGRAWVAMREDEDVAGAMGIHLVRTKLMAFAMGAMFAGIGGAIFASKLAIIYPHSFKLDTSINVLALIIIGGMGSIPGVIVGALALVGLPEIFREFADFRLLIYGIVLVLMMLVRPQGLWPEARRKLELEEIKEPEAGAVGK